MFKKKPRQYYYLLTVFCTENNKIAMGSGMLDWSGSRHEAFIDRFSDLCKCMGVDPKKTYVVHWTFEPNDLA